MPWLPCGSGPDEFPFYDVVMDDQVYSMSLPVQLLCVCIIMIRIASIIVIFQP